MGVAGDFGKTAGRIQCATGVAHGAGGVALGIDPGAGRKARGCCAGAAPRNDRRRPRSVIEPVQRAALPLGGGAPMSGVGSWGACTAILGQQRRNGHRSLQAAAAKHLLPGDPTSSNQPTPTRGRGRPRHAEPEVRQSTDVGMRCGPREWGMPEERLVLTRASRVVTRVSWKSPVTPKARIVRPSASRQASLAVEEPRTRHANFRPGSGAGWAASSVTRIPWLPDFRVSARG